jgi:hypothetical protein
MPTDLPRVTLRLALALVKYHVENLVGDEALGIIANELVDIGGEKVTAKLDSILSSNEGAAKLSAAGKR